MRLSVREERPSARASLVSRDDALIPMINVVLLLLIFLILSGGLRAPNPLAIEPPETATQRDPMAADPAISLAADGRLSVGTTLVADPSIAAGMLRARFPDDTPNSALPALAIRVSADADAVRTVDLVRALRAVGFRRVLLLTVSGATENR